MTAPQTAASLIATLQAERDVWEQLLAQVPKARMEQPGAVGEWSIKDLIVHITWSERETVGMLRARAFAGSPWWRLSHDERNAQVYAANRDRPLADVQAEAAETFEQLVAAIQPLDSEALSASDWFAQMPFPLPTWEVIARNSYRHYHAHLADVQAWLERETL